MAWLSKERRAMFCSYLGVYVLLLTVGTHLYWGNLSVYTNSYFRRKEGPGVGIQSLWVVSLVVTGLTVGNMVAGYIAAYIGHRCTLILGCLLLDIGVYSTYFSVQHSSAEVNLSIGLLPGLGFGLLFNMSLLNISAFEPKNIGLATAAIFTAINGGAAVQTQLNTLYLNPKNLTPDLCEKRANYFTQKEVLDAVPSLFLIIGTVNLCCHVIGVLLVRFPKERTGEETGMLNEKSSNGQCIETGDVMNGKEMTETLCGPPDDSNPNGSEHKVKEEVQTNRSVPPEDLSPKQLLRRRSFYALWLSCAFCDYSYMMMNNFYKIYGQTRIPDDQFLANLTTSQLVVVMMTRPCWGALMDKCGVKYALVWLSAAMSVVSSLWYFTPMVSKWMYFFWTVIFGSCNSGLMVVFPIATRKFYGKHHFSQNYGLVFTSVIVPNLLAPGLIRYALARFGWFYLFLSMGCGNALGTVLSVVNMPRM